MANIEVSWAQFEIPDHKPGYPPKFNPADCVDDAGCQSCAGGSCSVHQSPAQVKGEKPPQCSDHPIRYASGEVGLRATDMQSNGFGVPWGHTRSFAGKLSENTNIGNGFNWQVKEWRYIVEVDSQSVVVMGQSLEAIWFARNGNTFTPEFSSRQTLQLDEAANVYRLTELDGSVSEFSATTGGFQKRTDPAGNTLEVTSLSVDGFIPDQVERTYTNAGSTTIEQFLYEYDDSDPSEMLLTSVTLRRQVDGGNWSNVLRARYTYYTDGESYGSEKDLKTVTKQTWSNGAWANTGTTYYRYWKYLAPSSSSSSSNSSSSNSSSSPQKSAHLLKYVLLPSSYDRMIAAGDNPLTASDLLLSQYADNYYKYNSNREVTSEHIQGGSRTFDFAIEESSFAEGYNSWKYKTIETLPGGNESVVYSNYAGQTMLRVFRAPTGETTFDEWIDFWQYDSNGFSVLHASPSAVTGYDEQYADLLNQSGGSYEYLKDNDGFIQTFEYHDPTGFTTAQKIKKGQLGAEIKLREYEYTSCPPAGSSSSSSSSSSSGGSGEIIPPPIYFISKETEYPSDTDQTITNVTTYSYTFYPGTCQIKERVTTLPVVTTAQNGSGIAATRRDYYYEYGNLTWQMDERGFITNQQYDVVTGGITRLIQDVNTAVTSGAPAGWSTPSGGGLNLITDFESDDQGRLTQSLGPIHTIDLSGVATSIRRANWTVYHDSLFETVIGQGFQNLGTVSSSSSSSSASAMLSSGDFTLVNPVSIGKSDADGRNLEQIQATRANTAGKLLSTDTFAQSSYTRWQTTQYSDCCFVASQRVYHTIPTSGVGSSGTNYDQTTFGYTPRKIQNKQVTPGGTITRTVFDARRRPISTYVGTNDTGATTTDPTGGGAAGNNMVIITANQYDSGLAGGDDSLTEQTQHVDSSTTRVTNFTFDWRNRRTDTDGEIDYYQTTTYDNLDRDIQSDQHDTSAAGNLVARNQTKYDSRGRVYQRINYGVDPGTGTVGNALTSDTWFDAAGNVIKNQPAGSQKFMKTVYDGVGRATDRYTGYDLDESGYASAQSITDDTILEQIQTTYNDAGGMVQQANYKRYHNATGEGELNPPSGAQPKARRTFTTNYYDGIGRSIASVNYGTYGGFELTRPNTIPVRSDLVLVSSMTYDDAGNLSTSKNPGGVSTCFLYDDASRQTETRMGCTNDSSSSSSSSSSAGGGNCPPSDDTNVTVQTAYNADGNVASITAVNSSTGNQTTQYTYGTTLADSDIASSLLKRAEIYPDSVDASDQITFSYNRQSQPTTTTDQAGTVHSFDYDLLGRQTQDRITSLAAGVDGAVRRIETGYEVRGMRKTLTSYSSATVSQGSVVNDVQFDYNDYSQLTDDYQSHSGAVNTGSTPKVQYGYVDGTGNTIRQTTTTYPNGRELTYGYGANGSADNAISRIGSIIDDDASSTHLVDYSYLGAGDFVISDYTEPDVMWTMIGTAGGDDPSTGDIYHGLDRFGRIKDNYWRDYGGAADVDRIEYGYDRNGNRLWRENVVARSLGKDFDEKYMYDLIDRLKDMGRGELDANDNLTNKNFEQCWGLDATGNWKDFLEDDNGNGTWSLNQQRESNKVNEITNITETVGASWSTPAFSKAGNMTTVPKPDDPTQSFTATYDAWNRLTKLEDSSAVVVEYEYDGAKRRTIKKTHSGGVLDATRHLYNTELSKWQVIEERVDSSTDAERQFIWGLRYTDEIILRDRDTDGDGTLDKRLYGLQDANWNVTALIDELASVQERFTYHAYGSTEVLTSTFFDREDSSFNWETTFAGYRLEAESTLFCVRNRFLHTSLAWLQRDPIGYQDGFNLYEYTRSNPSTLVDPLGLNSERGFDDAECEAAYYRCASKALISSVKCWVGCVIGGDLIAYLTCLGLSAILCAPLGPGWPLCMKIAALICTVMVLVITIRSWQVCAQAGAIRVQLCEVNRDICKMRI